MSRPSILIARARANDPAPTRLRTVTPLRLITSISLGLAILVLPMSGCGSSDSGVAAKSASQILQATIAAAKSASSVHVIANSKIAHGGTIRLNASLAKTQGQARVFFYGLALTVICDGDTLYVKGNQSFAAHLGGALGVKVPSSTWLKGPTKGPLSQTAAFTDIEKELPVILSGSGQIAKGANTKIDGQPAITLKLTRKLYTGTLYVATTGQPYPLKLTKTGQETGQTTFTNWNDPVTVTPPAHAVEIAKLEHLKGG